MANEPKVPEVRDDDPEDVADKLSIAAAMWSRGDHADAVSWVRRAAESASDSEQDMRALELAKAASDLSTLHQAPTVIPEAAPPASPPRTAPPAAPTLKPSLPPGKAPAAASSLPKKPPTSRPGVAKLPPLPPLRPLGTPAPAPPRAARIPSMITSATGAASASGTVERDDTPPPPRANEPAKRMPWDDQRLSDDEPTKQISLSEHPAAPDALDDEHGSLDTMDSMDFDATREIAIMALQPVREEPPESTPPERVPPEPAAETQHELPLAVGVRVRVVVAADGVHVVPEGETTSGVAAVLVPLDGNDDLRSLFQRRA